MVISELTTQYLREILAQFSDLAALPESGCRCGDGPYDYLRKIVHVTRLDAGLPDFSAYEFRPGDSAFNLSFKTLVNLTADDCRCGDSIFQLWQRILESLRVACDLPNTPEFAFRPGDSLNDLLRKVLSVLANCDVVPVPPVINCCLLLESNGDDLFLESVEECLELESCVG